MGPWKLGHEVGPWEFVIGFWTCPNTTSIYTKGKISEWPWNWRSRRRRQEKTNEWSNLHFILFFKTALFDRISIKATYSPFGARSPLSIHTRFTPNERPNAFVKLIFSRNRTMERSWTMRIGHLLWSDFMIPWWKVALIILNPYHVLWGGFKFPSVSVFRLGFPYVEGAKAMKAKPVTGPAP